ncbi:MAG: ABC transporter ATP-binding protein [Actinobacteria bacterium]|jgi:branched-chain amino acid transport system ATP-binding protein|nr:ABC transporter ATP-binding protein [Actinomycetota bacterium]
MNLLEVDSIDVHYGDFQALYGVSVSVAAGETLAIIGANGAGKSTLMKALAGLMTPTSGSISFEGRDVTGMPSFKRVGLGIALTPEGRRIFPSLSVEENLLVGGHTRRKGPWNLASVYEAFPLVADRKDRIGIHLSGGEQQAVAIGRALMSNPSLLLLDEVSLGLAPVVVEQIYAALPAITGAGTTVLVVEQDVNQALKVSDRVQCMLEGRTVLEGAAGTLTRDQIATAYFGI